MIDFIICLFIALLARAAYISVDRKLLKIMATQAELATDLTALNDQVTKIGTETEGLKTAVAALEAALAAAGSVTPELQAAVDNLKAKVQSVDDLVADT